MPLNNVRRIFSDIKLKSYAYLYQATHGKIGKYFYFKWDSIGRSLSDANILRAFREGSALPAGYGCGVDERIVEYPWVLANLNGGAKKILDAGSTFNFKYILDNELISGKDLTIMTLQPEHKNFPSGKVHYVYGDLRSVPFEDNCFDAVLCVSTLEHVGMDNSMYMSADNSRGSKYKENDPESYLKAVAELYRIITPGGQLFITVPFGVRKDYGFFQQFDKDMIDSITSILGVDYCRPNFYKFNVDSWRQSELNECNNADYKFKTDTSIGRIASTAGAIACLKMIKPGSRKLKI